MATPMYYVPTQHPGQVGQPVVTTAPGGAAYYAPSQGVMLVQPRVPQYEYTPNSFLVFSIITAAVCGFFSPLSLMFTIPAYLFSVKSQRAARTGDINLAERRGMVAAYLNFTAIIFSLVVAALSIGLALGLYFPTYYLEQCKDEVEDRYTYYTDCYTDHYYK